MKFNRTRIKDLRVPTVVPSITSIHGNGTSLGTAKYQEYVGSRLTGELSQIQEFSHPGFSKETLGRQILMGDMEKVWAVHDIPVDYIYLGPYPEWNAGGRQILQGDIMQFIERDNGNPESANIANYTNRAKALALVRAYNRFQQFKVLSPEYVKEFKQTVSLFANPFASATTLLEKTRKLKQKNLGRLAPTVINTQRAAADAWLQTRYGWKPILSDYSAAGDEYLRFCGLIEKRESFLTARASDGLELDRSSSYDAPIVVGSKLRLRGDASFFTNIKVHAGVIYHVKREHGIDKLLTTMSLRSEQHTSVAWELLPYSFVADWFVNVGEWLTAINPDPNIEVLGSWTTSVLRENHVWRNCTWSCTQLGRSNNGNLGGSSLTRVTVTRDTAPELPLTPVVRLNKPTTKQIVDGLALTVGKCSRLIASLLH